MRFIDEIEFFVTAGRGGDGCVSFLRERFIPRGGPDGGDGGKGGDVIFEATSARNTLIDFRRNKVYKAKSGQAGKGKKMAGRGGADLLLRVPVGTMIFDAENDELLADLAEAGAKYIFRGGAGGKGNIHFKSSTNRTPRKFTEGSDGSELRVRLELKLLADVGLLGFPNAGKSTFISRVSNARPRVADYPFTTLVPSLGLVRVGDMDTFVVADIPGLIEGAHEGHGLGHQFLRHVERCALYLHLVAADGEGSPIERFDLLNAELTAYDNALLRRPQLVVLSKTDLLDEAAIEAFERPFIERGINLLQMSSVTGKGLEPLLHEVYAQVRLVRAAEQEADDLETGEIAPE